jgi:HlyD family secretion protein
MGIAAIRAAALVALVEGVIRVMFPSKPRAIAALAAVSLTLLVTLLLIVSGWWRPVPSDQGKVSAEAGNARNVKATAGPGSISIETGGAPLFTLKKSVFHRTTTQPATVQPAQLVEVYPKVSGELRSLSVEIGDRVTQGQVVAVIDAPEVRAELRKSQAMVDLARARARRVAIAVPVAEAMLLSERAKVEMAAAELKGSDALRVRREMERRRLKELADRKTLERRLLDEEDKWLESAQQTYMSKTALLAVAKADVQAAEARVEAARAENDEAQAEVWVAEANQAGPEMLSVAARVIAPIDGIVTGRTHHVGDSVRAGDAEGLSPLLTIVQASRVRIVVKVPDRDAVFLDKGDTATFRPDALPERTYRGPIARTAVAEEQGTLRSEIDLDNSDGRLRPGQLGHVTIALEDRPDTLTIPMTAILEEGPEARGKYRCYRVTDGRAVLTPIRLGVLCPDANLAEVLDGITEGDIVVPDRKSVEDPDRVDSPGSAVSSGAFR